MIKEKEVLQRVKTLDRQSRKSWGREERRKTYMHYRERVSVSISFIQHSISAKIFYLRLDFFFVNLATIVISLEIISNIRLP